VQQNCETLESALRRVWCEDRERRTGVDSTSEIDRSGLRRPHDGIREKRLGIFPRHALSESDSTARVFSCFAKSRRRGAHRFLGRRSRTGAEADDSAAPVVGSVLDVDSGMLRHGINRAVSWAPANSVATSASGIDAAILSPVNSGEPWHIAVADPQMATPREGVAKGRAVRRTLGNSPSERGFHDLSLGRGHVRRAF
jgi:hypothetical protein